MFKQDKEGDIIKGVAIFPFCGSVTNRITHIAQSQNIKTVTISYKKIKDLLNSVEDPLGLRVAGFYEIPFYLW